MSVVTNTDFCVGPQNKISNPSRRYRQLMKVPVLSSRGILIGSETCVIMLLAVVVEGRGREREFWFDNLQTEKVGDRMTSFSALCCRLSSKRQLLIN